MSAAAVTLPPPDYSDGVTLASAAGASVAMGDPLAGLGIPSTLEELIPWAGVVLVLVVAREVAELVRAAGRAWIASRWPSRSSRTDGSGGVG